MSKSRENLLLPRSSSSGRSQSSRGPQLHFKYTSSNSRKLKPQMSIVQEENLQEEEEPPVAQPRLPSSSIPIVAPSINVISSSPSTRNPINLYHEFDKKAENKSYISTTLPSSSPTKTVPHFYEEINRRKEKDGSKFGQHSPTRSTGTSFDTYPEKTKEPARNPAYSTATRTGSRLYEELDRKKDGETIPVPTTQSTNNFHLSPDRFDKKKSEEVSSFGATNSFNNPYDRKHIEKTEDNGYKLGSNVPKFYESSPIVAQNKYSDRNINSRHPITTEHYPNSISYTTSARTNSSYLGKTDHRPSELYSTERTPSYNPSNFYQSSSYSSYNPPSRSTNLTSLATAKSTTDPSTSTRNEDYRPSYVPSYSTTASTKQNSRDLNGTKMSSDFKAETGVIRNIDKEQPKPVTKSTASFEPNAALYKPTPLFALMPKSEPQSIIEKPALPVLQSVVQKPVEVIAPPVMKPKDVPASNIAQPKLQSLNSQMAVNHQSQRSRTLNVAYSQMQQKAIEEAQQIILRTVEKNAEKATKHIEQTQNQRREKNRFIENPEEEEVEVEKFVNRIKQQIKDRRDYDSKNEMGALAGRQNKEEIAKNVEEVTIVGTVGQEKEVKHEIVAPTKESSEENLDIVDNNNSKETTHFFDKNFSPDDFYNDDYYEETDITIDFLDEETENGEQKEEKDVLNSQTNEFIEGIVNDLFNSLDQEDLINHAVSEKLFDLKENEQYYNSDEYADEPTSNFELSPSAVEFFTPRNSTD